MPANNMCRQGIPSQEGLISAWPTNGHPIDEFFKQYEDVSVSTQPDFFDTMRKNEREDDAMSLVGMRLYEDKIVAFGDSKPSIMTSLGSYAEDKERGKIPKVFMTDDYILATCGTNQFLTMQDKTKVLINIEDWITNNIRNQPDYLELVQTLSECIIDGSVSQNSPIQILVGSGGPGRLFVQRISVAMNNLVLGNRSIIKQWYFSGTDYYLQKQQEIMIGFGNEGNGKTLDDRIRTTLKKHIEAADTSGIYNPVGGEIRVLTWRPKKSSDSPASTPS